MLKSNNFLVFQQSKILPKNAYQVSVLHIEYISDSDQKHGVFILLAEQN